jgi:ActD protein
MKAVYGLYPDGQSAQQAVNRLRAAGLANREITVISSQPMDDYEFGQMDKATWMWWIASGGGLLGMTAAIGLAWLTQTPVMRRALVPVLSPDGQFLTFPLLEGNTSNILGAANRRWPHAPPHRLRRSLRRHRATGVVVARQQVALRGRRRRGRGCRDDGRFACARGTGGTKN